MAVKKKAVESVEAQDVNVPAESGKPDALNERIAELEAAVKFARDTIDPGGIIAPQPGTPGYMIDVIKALHRVCPLEK